MRILITILLLFSSLFSFSQELRGHLVEIRNCKLLESGYAVLKTKRAPAQTYVKLTQEKFSIYGELHIIYNLHDKQVDSSDKDNLIVHFFGEGYRKTWIIGVRYCDPYITVAVFPTDGRETFVEYIFKPRKK